MSPGAAFQFSVSHTHRQGALLSIRHTASHTVAVRERALKDYMLEHYEQWFNFIRMDRGHDVQLKDIMLVTECHLTADWATGVWTESSASGQVSSRLSAFLNASASGERRRYIHIPPRYSPDPDRILAGGTTDEIRRDQCIFLRGYWVKDGLFGLKLKAAAGPHDLGSDMEQGPRPTILSSDVWQTGEEQSHVSMERRALFALLTSLFRRISNLMNSL